jgi:hypothetical protein
MVLYCRELKCVFNPFNAELNPICHLLALLGSHHILHFSRIRVKFNEMCMFVSVWTVSRWQNSIVLWLGSGLEVSRVPFAAGARDFLVLLNIHRCSGAHPPSWSLGARVLAQGLHSLVVQFTIHHPLMQRLRVSGAVLLLKLYVFMPWVETTLPLQE